MIIRARTLLWLACGLTLAAQTSPGPTAPRTLRFIGLEGDFSNLEMAMGRTDSIKLTIAPKSFSNAYPCPGADEIVLFRWIIDTDEHGQPRKTRTQMAGIPIPAGAEKWQGEHSRTRDCLPC